MESTVNKLSLFNFQKTQLLEVSMLVILTIFGKTRNLVKLLTLNALKIGLNQHFCVKFPHHLNNSFFKKAPYVLVL